MSGSVALKTTAVVVAVGFGVFAAAVLWPHYDTKKPIGPEPPPPTVVPALPAADPAVARFGTDSSLSREKLPLYLVSTSPGRSPKEGTATLGPDPRNPQTYGAGAILENGAEIVEIHADHVVLALDGKRARLSLDPAAIQEFTTKSVASTAVSKATRTPLTVHDLAKFGSAELTTVGGYDESKIARISRPTLDTRSDEIIRIQLAYRSDELYGFRVSPASTPYYFERLGLKPGDVITGVDGRRIESEADWADVASALDEGKRLNISIERDGALAYLALDTSALESAAEQNPAAEGGHP